MAVKSMSRRSLIKGAALGGAALGVAGALNISAASADEKADTVEWDAEYDVVVLGLGAAGCNAAVAAYEEGATVLAVEKAPEGSSPCNSNAAGQEIIATDDAEALYTYLSALAGQFGNWDEEALHALCVGAAGNWNWAADVLGMDTDVACPTEIFSDMIGPCTWTYSDNAWGMGRAGYMPLWNEYPELEGNEHCYIIIVGPTNFDSGYYNLCLNAVATRNDGENLTVWRPAVGKDLILDDNGAVIGAVVEKDGQLFNIKANDGVCLCTGGFEADPDMMSSFTQQPYVYLQAGTTNTGDGIKMAQKAGAQLWHMSNVAGWLWAYQNPELSTCKTASPHRNGILAGCNGARFHNESLTNRHGRINIDGRWISTPMPLPSYCIVDSDQIDKKLVSTFSEGNVEEIASGLVITGDTIEELAANIRAIGDAPDFNANGELTNSLSLYNAHCHANNGEGEVDDFGRMCTVPVENGPFYAIKLGPSMYNTQGGPRHNGMSQVIGLDGYPIEGLFEAGEMGSVFCDMYNGGGNLCETMVFGRYAGQNAAKRAKGEFQGAIEKAMTHNERLMAAVEEEAATTLNIASVANGTYEGTGRGYGGLITLSVEINDGRIVSCEVVASSESSNYGELALPDYCAAIVETQDLDAIDVSSGASNTLHGFKAAIENALA